MRPDLLPRRGVTAPLQEALTNGGESPVATLRVSLEGLTRGSAPSTPKGPAPRRAGSRATGFAAMANRGFADRRRTAMGAYVDEVPEAAPSSAAPKPKGS